jgi:AraC-like DNA-binding protein
MSTRRLPFKRLSLDDRIEVIAEACGYVGEEQMRAACVRMLQILPRDYQKRLGWSVGPARLTAAAPAR